MAIEYHSNSDDELTTIRVTGEVTLVEMLERAREMLSDPAFDSTLPALFDVRGLEMSLDSETPDQWLRFTRFIRERQGDLVGNSMAVLVDAELDPDICADIHWLCCAVAGTELFDSYDLAVRWLYRREFRPALVSPH